MKKYSIDLKRVLINICIITIMLIAFNFITNFTFGNKHIDTKSITVNDNDTLWNIAKDVCCESDEELNIQNVVIEIKNINQLKSSNIYAGQVLNVPIYN